MAKSAVSSPSTSLVSLVLGLLGVGGGIEVAGRAGDALQCGVVGSARDFSVADCIVSESLVSASRTGPAQVLLKCNAGCVM